MIAPGLRERDCVLQLPVVFVVQFAYREYGLMVKGLLLCYVYDLYLDVDGLTLTSGHGPAGLELLTEL